LLNSCEKQARMTSCAARYPHVSGGLWPSKETFWSEMPDVV
jgi:hypothetical protein